MSSRRQRSIPSGGRYRQVSLYCISANQSSVWVPGILSVQHGISIRIATQISQNLVCPPFICTCPIVSIPTCCVQNFKTNFQMKQMSWAKDILRYLCLIWVSGGLSTLHSHSRFWESMHRCAFVTHTWVTSGWGWLWQYTYGQKGYNTKCIIYQFQ